MIVVPHRDEICHMCNLICTTIMRLHMWQKVAHEIPSKIFISISMKLPSIILVIIYDILLFLVDMIFGIENI